MASFYLSRLPQYTSAFKPRCARGAVTLLRNSLLPTSELDQGVDMKSTVKVLRIAEEGLASIVAIDE
jgi:hypothetical protein